MQQACLVCDRTAPDRNLFCQDIRCPAEISPLILDYGEWLGDIEIVRPVVVLRASVLYEARRQEQLVLLKVAHPGPEHTDRLRREAQLLALLGGQKEPVEHVPTLLPPYSAGVSEATVYGKAMLRGQLLYYYVCSHFAGESLRDVLAKTPQLWINHVGWIAQALALVMAHLQRQGYVHLGLTPEAVLVRFDRKPPAPRVLLADLGLACELQAARGLWYRGIVPRAYTAPELLTPGADLSYAADVYGLGLTLYELLVGVPAVPAGQRGDDEIDAAVSAGRLVHMSRVEDVRPVAELAAQAVSLRPQDRQQSAATLAAELRERFGPIPPPMRARITVRLVLTVVVILLAAAFLAALLASIGGIIAGA